MPFQLKKFSSDVLFGVPKGKQVNIPAPGQGDSRSFKNG